MKEYWERFVSDEIADVKIDKKKFHLIIWIVPLIALLIGGWMLYRYYSKMGPLVMITFNNSGGLEPKHSFVRFRDVKVGVVERIEILKQKEGVRVYARMNKDVKPFLNETTKFWIVKPEIGLGKIRGLDALMSGAYIQMDAKLGSEQKLIFKGLDEPPLIQEDMQGSNVKLVSSTSYGLSEGMNVYYKQLKVGSVKKVDLSGDGQKVFIYIFVKHPYDKLINDTSRFWNLRGFSFELTDTGIDVRMGTLSQFLVGGVEFDTKDIHKISKISLEKPYILYPSRAQALQKKLGLPREEFARFLLEFDGGTGYLAIGSSVRFEGYKVGSVEDIISFFDASHKKIDSKVLVRIDLSSFQNSPQIPAIKAFEEAVEKGLKAKLEHANPVTKSLFVNLVFDKKPGSVKKLGNDIYTMPTLPYQPSKLMLHLETLLTKLENMPIERSLNALSNLLEKNSDPLRQTLLSLRQTSDSLHKLLESEETRSLPKDIHKLLVDLDRTLASYEILAKTYSKNSLFKEQLTQTLKDVDKASKALRKVLLKLDKKPNALIFGD